MLIHAAAEPLAGDLERVGTRRFLEKQLMTCARNRLRFFRPASELDIAVADRGRGLCRAAQALDPEQMPVPERSLPAPLCISRD